MKQLPLKTLVFCAVLAAFSAAAQLVHIGYQSPQWGMWIDIVAVSWMIAFFLFGLTPALIVSALGALVITLFAPDTWLGASMKLVATLPVIISFFLYQRTRYQHGHTFRKLSTLIVPIVLGIILRSLLVIPLNYYYAIPIWTKMTPVEAIAAIPWYIIAGFNAVQTVVDVVFAWVIVYQFRLSRYGIEKGNHETPDTGTEG